VVVQVEEDHPVFLEEEEHLVFQEVVVVGHFQVVEEAG